MDTVRPDTKSLQAGKKSRSSSKDPQENGTADKPLDDDDSSEEGWEDTEVDAEEDVKQFESFSSGQYFSTLDEFFSNTVSDLNLDFIETCVKLDLDDLDIIRLINYIRSQIKDGKTDFKSLQSKEQFADDEYLVPAIQEDALLIHLGDIVDLVQERRDAQAHFNKRSGGDEATAALSDRLSSLEDRNRQLEAQLAVAKSALEAHYIEPHPSDSKARQDRPKPNSNAPHLRDDDSHYFESYSYNDIHEIMLKDTTRTDAYRDFIYLNKELFKDKIVLDVGCGTGILSMFCARAGAKKVIAVDNSEILHKAHQNVWDNGLDKVVTCILGKIEEVHLPVDKVDIIVSEWMGYCLLYEAMLDSVLWARDRYLKPDGLMVPSHCTLRIAPISDPDYLGSKVHFWTDVYGFSMTSMYDKIDDDVLLRIFDPEQLIAPSQEFMTLPLHSITRDDLCFKDRAFKFDIGRDVDMLDGFAIWFDTFFARKRDVMIEPEGVEAGDWAKKGDGEVAFTTGPGGKETHWQQCMMMISHATKENPPVPLKKGQVVKGTVGYSKSTQNSRELEVEVAWEVEGADDTSLKEAGRKKWSMR